MPVIRMGRNRNAEYWERRFRMLEEAKQRSADVYVDQIERQYKIAIDAIHEKIRSFIERYAKNDHITKAEADRLLTNPELDKFKMDVNEYIRLGEKNARHYSPDVARELERASIRYRVTRLEALELELKAEIASVYGLADELTYQMAAQLYREQYARTAFEIFKGTGVIDTTFAMPNFDIIENLIRTPWTVDGLTFSEHLWGDQTKFCQSLIDVMFQMLVLGEGYDVAADRLYEKYGGMLRDCQRVIYTEAAFFQGLAQNKCYQDLGVERYQFLCELNLGTCEKCIALDGKVFGMNERRIGVNAIPMHPRCRCVEIPYINDENIPGYIEERRSGRNEYGKSVFFPAGMTYDEWWKEYGEKLQERRNNY